MLLTLVAFLCCAVPTLAQSVQYTQNKADLKSRGDFSVDPSTLALGMEIPLGSYPGRAGTGLPISLRYSSKVWRTEYAGHKDLNPHAQGWTTPMFAEHSISGWTSSLNEPWLEDGMTTMTFTSLGSSPDCPPEYPCVSQEYLYGIFRFYAHLPDGSTHELRKSDTAVRIDPPTSPPADPSGTYYAVDGSQMRLEYHTGAGAPPNVLYMPDGSRYIWDDSSGAILVKYVDSNGNTLTYNSSARQWTDTLGRTFVNPLPAFPAAGDQTYMLPGASGSPITYTFRWRHLADALSTPVAEADRPYKAGWSTCDLTNGTTVSPNLFGGCHGDDGVARFNPVVLAEIVLPTGRSYRFTYNLYGEIEKVVYPTGGYERYVYAQLPMAGYVKGTAYAETNRGVTDRYVSASGAAADEVRWQYSASFADNTTRALPYKTAVTAPDGTRTERLLYAEQQHPPCRLDHVLTGKAYEERVIAPGGQMLRRKLTKWEGSNSTQTYPIRDPRVTKEVEILLDTGGAALAAATTYQYDSDLNVTGTSRYAYTSVDQATAQSAAIDSIPQPQAPLRTEETDYLTYDQNYRARNLTSLPVATRVKDAAGNVVAQSQMFYDETPLAPYSAVTAWADPGTAARGNLTRASRWVNTTNTWLDTRTEYDQCGSPVKTIDALGYESQIAYSAAYAYAYPTSTTSAAPNPVSEYGQPAGAFGSPAGFTTTTAYDFSTGFVTSTTDANGKITTFNYGDPLNRLKRIDLPDGGRTTYTYVDAHQCGAYVETRTLLDASGRETDAYQFFDGLGRPYLSETLDGQDASNQFLRVDTRYDSLGRVSQVSNPYYASGCAATPNPLGQWTTTEYDSLGRVVKVTTPDSAAVTTSYAGTQVTVTDQAVRKRSSVTDALGRLTQVTEDAAPGGHNYLTTYTYDVLGNLRKVDQDGQQRFFMYDSLSRLIRAKNPEQGDFTPDNDTPPELSFPALTDQVTSHAQWSTGYSYDANGNLIARKDARNVKTVYRYDHLNRNILVSYSDGTPGIKRIYDTAENGLGRYRADWTWDGASTYYTHRAVDHYDAAGRPLDQRQYFYTNNAAGTPFTTKRTYDLAGNVLTQTYPSGHTISYNYDLAGRLADNGTQAAFSGNLGDGVPRAYAAGLSYSEFGGLRQERFGTQVPLYHKLHYNRRGQLNDIRLSTVAWGTDEWNWNRGALINYYATADLSCQTNACRAGSGFDNNGNLLRQQHYIPSDDAISSYTFTEDRYSYDDLNRLTSVEEFPGTPAGYAPRAFKQVYTYDAWGNRTVNLSDSAGVPAAQYDFERRDLLNTNRLYAPGDLPLPVEQRRMRYDGAGNLAYDSYTGAGGRTYDAENRMIAAYDRTGNWAYYAYDADGRRVKRKVGGEEWWQVYGLGGELLAEYRAGAAPYLPSKEYGYRGGELLVTMASGDDERLKRFVTNLYYGALQRDPTAQELQETTNQLALAGTQGQAELLRKAKQVARGLFLQTNYEFSPYRSETQYVTDLYYTYLQRAPDDGGLNYWVGAAAGGVTNRSNVCDGFQESAEFQAVVSTLYGTAAGDDERTDHFINNFYLGAYGRPATAEELQQERADLNREAAKGQTEVKAQAEAMGRRLFAAQVSDLSLSAQQFVTNLYEAFLQRGPDAVGLSNWTAAAGTTAQSRQNVLNAFAGCDPFRELAGTLYRETFWLVTDHLGTPRMIADRTGSLAGVKRHDYLPFGEELYANAGGRTPTQGYSAADNVRQKFTKKERDVETGLDYFEARYYSSPLGRFTSPDEFTGGPDELFDFADDAAANPTFYANLHNPQSLNKYQYTYNNPLRYVDPDGHDADDPQIPIPIPVPPPPVVGVPPQSQAPPDPIIAIKQGWQWLQDNFFEPGRQSSPIKTIRQIVGTSPEVSPEDVPAPAMPQTGTLPQQQAQPMPPPPPAQAEHTKGKRKSTHDKHTKVRPGQKQPPNYRPFRRPPPQPKQEPKGSKPKPTPKPEIGPDGKPVRSV